MSTEVSVIGLVNNQLYQTVLNRLSNHSHSFSHFSALEIGFDRGPPEATVSDPSNILRLKHSTRTPQITNNQSPLNFKNPIRNGWTLTSHGRTEPERLSPEFSIRPSYSCPIIAGNPIEFVSALGYRPRRKFEFFRRGVQFLRGGVIIEIFQVFQNEKDQTPMAGPEGHLITVTAIIPTAARGTTTSSTSSTTPAPPPPPTATATATATATTTTTTTTTTANTSSGANPGTSSANPNSGPTVQELRNEACTRVREIQAILKGLADLGRVEPS